MKLSEPDRVLTRMLHAAEALSTLQFLYMLAVFIFYLSASLQNSSDTTLFLLLDVLRVLGFTAAIVNLLALVLIIIWSIRHYCFLWARLVFSIFSLTIGLILSLFVSVIYGFITPV